MQNKLRIYLDNCCYNRPYDDQNNFDINIETLYILQIQKLVLKNEISLVWSFMLNYENNKNKNVEAKNSIQNWETVASIIIRANDEILDRARKYQILGLKPADSLHISSAVQSNANFFITVDKKILNKKVNDIKLTTPQNFYNEIYGGLL